MPAKRNSTVEKDLEWLVNTYAIPWENLRDKSVLITGAAGFLAAYMVETLLYLNETQQFNSTVIAVVRNKNSYNKRFQHYLDRQELVCIEQDVNSFIQLDRKVDYIIHAASLASPKHYTNDPVGTLSANTIGTSQLLELARLQPLKGFLYFSSAEVYGEPTRVPTSESDYGYLDPLALRSCYSESKRMGENMCVSWHRQYAVPAKIVRPFHTYGPGMSLDDGRVYADFVADVLNDRDIILKSDGLARRSFCYLADATAAFWMVLLKGLDAQAYNIGNPSCEISIFDLANLVSKLYPDKNLTVKRVCRSASERYIPSRTSVSCPDIRLANNLGWYPYTSIENGFRKTIGSYQK